MAITVGLDFGTHQTKICIENSDDPNHVTYEFYEWEPGVFALPSIIQINKDHTVSYGKIDMENVLWDRKKKPYPKPNEEYYLLPPLPEKPKVSRPRIRRLPSMPNKIIKIDGNLTRVPYSDLYGIGKTLRKKMDYPEYREWVDQCNLIDDYFEVLHEAWKRLKGLCPEYDLPEPQLPPLPHEPHLDGYCYDFHPELIASKSEIQEYKVWEATFWKLKEEEKMERINYEKEMADYKEKLKAWNEECINTKKIYNEELQRHEDSNEPLPLVFRYFKQAVFSSYKWTYEISARTLCVLYLSNIIFKLEEKHGSEFSIQMGVPASENNFIRLKEFASGLLIQAYRMVEVVFGNDYEKFLNTPFEELVSMIPEFEYSFDLKEDYGIMILPEAYAAIRSLTNNSRIPEGMSIMLDIGGGTTDISFFVIEEKGEPHVYHYASLAKGLNFFLEYGENMRSKDFTIKKGLDQIDKVLFEQAYKEYKNNIDSVVLDLTRFLHSDFIIRGFNKSNFIKAMRGRPAVYTGGGSYDSRLRQSILDFTDVKQIEKKNLAIPNVVDEQKVTIPYSILGTAYGLSIQRDDDEVTVSKREDFFGDLTNKDEKEDRLKAHREHGMYED